MRHHVSLATIVASSALALASLRAVAADAPPSEPAPAPAETTAATPAAPVPPPPPPVPDATLQKIISDLRETPIGAEPTAISYLDLVQAGHATAPQVNDLAAYLTKRGMPRVGLAFQEYATHLKPGDATLWLNLGTIRRTTGSLGPAATAFKKAIALDPGNAMAYYNLGAVYDAEKSYDEAIEQYRRALVLDPSLGDPRKNPQVVNNQNLLAVKLQIYSNQAGSLGLPLLQMQKKNSADKPAAPPKTDPETP